VTAFVPFVSFVVKLGLGFKLQVPAVVFS